MCVMLAIPGSCRGAYGSRSFFGPTGAQAMPGLSHTGRSNWRHCSGPGPARPAAAEEMMTMTETLDSAGLLADEAPVLQAAKATCISEVVPVESLLPAVSPRISGEDPGHTRLLREKLSDLPAILVNRRT